MIRLRSLMLTAAIAATGLAARPGPDFSKEPPMSPAQLKHLTPVLIVDAVEPCVAFWVDRFGFTLANPVPGPDGKLIFASVEKEGVEIMYQTRASVLAEDPRQAGHLDGHSAVLFITVADLAAVERAVAGAPVVKPRHQ